MEVKEIKPDYDLILYVYRSLKNNIKPSVNMRRIKGMYLYVKNRDFEGDEILVTMLCYIIEHMDKK